MAKDLNQVTLMGRLTHQPELKTTNSGKNICSFSLAVNGFGEDKVNFIECKAWEKTAEIIAKYVSKGHRLLVVGELEQETWQKDGQNRSKLAVLVREIQFIEKREVNEAWVEKQVETATGQPIDLSQIPF